MNTIFDSLVPQFSSKNCQATFIQMLECTFLIENSIAPDTVIGRCKLMKGNLSFLSIVRKLDSFNIDFQTAIDFYKQAYYDRQITTLQVALIKNPDLKIWEDFFYWNINRSAFNYIDSQQPEINALQMSSAKERRRIKVHEMIVENNKAELELFSPDYSDSIAKLTDKLYRYAELKYNLFDQYFIIIVNETEYTDENNAPIPFLCKIDIKDIKISLWKIQFDIINQPYKIKFRVNGNNIQLEIDEKAIGIINKIKSTFPNQIKARYDEKEKEIEQECN